MADCSAAPAGHEVYTGVRCGIVPVAAAPAALAPGGGIFKIAGWLKNKAVAAQVATAPPSDVQPVTADAQLASFL